MLLDRIINLDYWFCSCWVGLACERYELGGWACCSIDHEIPVKTLGLHLCTLYMKKKTPEITRSSVMKCV